VHGACAVVALWSLVVVAGLLDVAVLEAVVAERAPQPEIESVRDKTRRVRIARA
jgi:hypothetical protein